MPGRTAAWCVVRFRPGQNPVIFPRDGLSWRNFQGELISSHRTREAALKQVEKIKRLAQW